VVQDGKAEASGRCADCRMQSFHGEMGVPCLVLQFWVRWSGHCQSVRSLSLPFNSLTLMMFYPTTWNLITVLKTIHLKHVHFLPT